MIVSLMALPVGAATAACPDSIPSAGFTDLTGLDAEIVDAVDCLFAYGITTGTGTGVYGPTDDVPRWQMALFLVRQAADHGVTVPAAVDQGFTDLAGLDAATVAAINQLKQLGITTGVTATTFDPFGDVERWQMALFLTRLISAAGITLPSGATGPFTDLAGVDAGAVTAINQLNALDIAKGTTATTFDPTGNVLRWTMALFLTRVLDKGGVVYPGVQLAADVTTQATSSKVKLTVTVGDSANMPAEGQRVEVLVAKDFNTDGTVKTYAAGDDLGGSGVATGGTDGAIDLTDPVADASGMVKVDLTTTNNAAHSVTVVAWIGSVGDTYSSTKTQAKVTIAWTAGATDAELTTTDDTTGADITSVPSLASAAKYGETEGFTFQLVDTDGDPVAIAGAKLRVLRYFYDDGVLISQTSADVVTDASGAYTESHTMADPGATSTEDNDSLAWIFVYWDRDGDGDYLDASPGSEVGDVSITFNDDKAVVSSVSLSATDAADQDGFATATVTVLDQYANPCSVGCLVRFDWTNDDVAGFESGDERTLNSSGKASITIGGPGTNAVASNDVIAVRVDGDDTTAGWQDPLADDDTDTVAWFDDAPKDLYVGFPAAVVTVVDVQKGSDYFVATFAGDNWKFSYLATDQYTDGVSPSTLTGFETDLVDGLPVTVYYDRDGTAPDVSSFGW